MFDGKPHLSATQLNMFTRCGEQYRRRYIEKEAEAPGFALVVGTAVHSCAERNFRQKLESHEDLPVKEVKEAAAAAFDAQDLHEIMLTPDETDIGKDRAQGHALDKTVALAGLHAEKQAPAYQPMYVEQKFVIDLGPLDLIGFIDLIDDARHVIDIKTSKKKPPQSEADRSVQLTVYAAGHKALTGELPDDVRLDVLVSTKTPTRWVVSSTRESRDFVVLTARINAITKAIEAGVFPPADPSSWMCSERWCGFAKSCPYFNPRKEQVT